MAHNAKFEHDKKTVSSAIRGTRSIGIGRSYVVEFVHHTSLDAFCAALERGMGIVHSVKDYERDIERSDGIVARQRVYSVTATIYE